MLCETEERLASDGVTEDIVLLCCDWCCGELCIRDEVILLISDVEECKDDTINCFRWLLLASAMRC